MIIKGAEDNMGDGANYSKFKVDNSATMGEPRIVDYGEPIGQEKFSGKKRCINDDPTRDTEDDTKAEVNYGDGDCDDTQGGMY